MFSIIWFAATLVGLVPQAAPSPAPIDLTLPEIGRVKSVTPVCAAMRDLIIPAWTAARMADAKFSKVIEPNLPAYATLLAHEDTKYGPEREMRLSRIGSATATMFQEAQKIDKALNDPRLSADSSDPQIRELHKKLESVYLYQEGRASILNEFQLRENVALGQHLSTDNDGLGTGGRGVPGTNATPIPPSPTPLPGSSEAPNGQPNFTGIDIQDAANARQWTRDVSFGVHASEEQAAKTFLPIAKSCL